MRLFCRKLDQSRSGLNLDRSRELNQSHTMSKLKEAGLRKVVCKPKSRGKLPGWGMLIELCCDETSPLGECAKEFKGVKVIRITARLDWSSPETVEQVIDLIKAFPGISVHASLECTPWTSWQNMNVHMYGKEYEEDLKRRRDASRRMLASYTQFI